MATETEDTRGELRIMFDKKDPTYIRIVKNAKKQLRTPAKEAKLFLKNKYK